jgi:hypothetical protein
MWVTSVENYQQDGVVFKGNVRGKSPAASYAKLKQRLKVTNDGPDEPGDDMAAAAAAAQPEVAAERGTTWDVVVLAGAASTAVKSKNKLNMEACDVSSVDWCYGFFLLSFHQDYCCCCCCC